MPELPEVETVVRQLHTLIGGRRIRSLELLDPRLDALPARALSGCRVARVFRVGKQVVLELARAGASSFLVVHLRMTGRLCWQPGHRRPPRPHLRARLRLDGGELQYCDQRRFGTLRLVRSLKDITPRGLDPTSQDFTTAALAGLLAGSTQELKVWLMRQDRLVGLGNIYASEILFEARLNPLRPVGTLSAVEARRLHRAIGGVLSRAIARCGTTFSDFQDAEGLSGSYQHCLKVFRREGQPCPRCRRPITRVVQQQRSTFFCAACQRGDRLPPRGEIGGDCRVRATPR